MALKVSSYIHQSHNRLCRASEHHVLSLSKAWRGPQRLLDKIRPALHAAHTPIMPRPESEERSEVVLCARGSRRKAMASISTKLPGLHSQAYQVFRLPRKPSFGNGTSHECLWLPSHATIQTETSSQRAEPVVTLCCMVRKAWTTSDITEGLGVRLGSSGPRMMGAIPSNSGLARASLASLRVLCLHKRDGFGRYEPQCLAAFLRHAQCGENALLTPS